MNFNFGEVLSRAGQITWKHKNLWLAGIVIGLIGLVPALISLMFGPSFFSFTDPSEMNRQMPSILLMNAVTIFLSILTIPVYVIAMSIPSLGTLRLERGSAELNFGELVRASLPYFWRILGIFLLIGLGIFLVSIVFAGCIAVLGVLTFGLASMCVFPIFLLFIPIGLAVFALVEQGMTAIVVDDMRALDALQRGWELLRKNLGVMLLLSLLIYLGSLIIGMILSVPMMIPMFGFMTNMMNSAGQAPDIQSFERMFRNMMWWMLAFSPLYAVLQGILLTFMQSVWTLTYMRLTRGAQVQLLPQGATS